MRLVARRAVRRLRRARLPLDGRGGRRRPRAAGGRRRPAGGLRGAGRPDRRPGPGPRQRRPRAAARRGLAVRRGRRRRRRRARAAGVVAAARGARPPGGRPTPREAAALWRIREDGAGLAARSLRDARRTPAGRTPPSRRSGSGAWLRDFDELLREHGLDGVPYGHFGDGCVHVRIDFPFEPGADGSAKVFRDFLTACALKLRDHGGSLSGEHGDGRARSELLPLMYDARVAAALRRGQGDLRPRQPAQPRQPGRPGAARRRPARRSGPGCRSRRCCGFAHDGGELGERGAPLHRRRQVRGAGAPAA